MKILNEDIVIQETLLRLGNCLPDINQPRVAAWYQFYCKIQPKRWRDAGTGKSPNRISVLLAALSMPEGWTAEIMQAFDGAFVQLFEDAARDLAGVRAQQEPVKRNSAGRIYAA